MGALLQNLEDVLREVTHFYFVFVPLLIQMFLRFLDLVHLKKAGAKSNIYITHNSFSEPFKDSISDQFFLQK